MTRTELVASSGSYPHKSSTALAVISTVISATVAPVTLHINQSVSILFAPERLAFRIPASEIRDTAPLTNAVHRCKIDYFKVHLTFPAESL